MMRAAARARGFTLVELTIALVLMAAIAALSYGSLSLAARTWDGGEAKMQQVSDLRTTQTYLRAQMPLWRGHYPGVENMHVAVMGCVVNIGNST